MKPMETENVFLLTLSDSHRGLEQHEGEYMIADIQQYEIMSSVFDKKIVCVWKVVILSFVLFICVLQWVSNCKGHNFSTKKRYLPPPQGHDHQPPYLNATTTFQNPINQCCINLYP